jgi:hypothetical protein
MVARRLVASASLLTLAMVVLAANAGSCNAQAQSVPNLSGTWELVEIKPAMGLKPSDAKFGKLMLAISQAGSQMKITQKRTFRGTVRATEYSYYTDGRGETNIGRIETFPYERKTESASGWKQERLLIEYITESSLANPDRGISRKDEWRLGSNRTLILTITTVGGGRAFSTGGNGGGAVGLSGYGKRKFIFREV